MTAKRRGIDWHAGERAENKARSDRKKPITAKHPGEELLETDTTIPPMHRATVTRLVATRARDDADRQSLLEHLGLAEVGV